MRLFIALPLSSEIEIYLDKLIETLKNNCDRSASVKWVKPGNIHLTVKFLGETDPCKVDGIIEALNLSVIGNLPINSAINRIGAFPNLSRPRIIWAGLHGGNDELVELAAKVDSAVSRLGFQREERPFKAHLTLARVRDSRGIQRLASFMKEFDLKPVDLCLDKLVLFESNLTPRGPIYRRLHELPLGQERFEG